RGLGLLVNTRQPRITCRPFTCHSCMAISWLHSAWVKASGDINDPVPVCPQPAQAYAIAATGYPSHRLVPSMLWLSITREAIMNALAKLALTLFLSCVALLSQAQTQTISTAPPDFSRAELDQMLAPVALYPDTVLSHVLIAATYPLEVVQAA